MLTKLQVKVVVRALERNANIFDYEGLPEKVRASLPLLRDNERIEHDCNRFIFDYVSTRESQLKFF